MSGRLPREIDPIRLADEGVRLRGELAGSSMTRLIEVLPGGRAAQPVTVDLSFERTVHGERLMRGVIETAVEATCQRCLGPVRIALTARPCAVLLQPDAAPAITAEETEAIVVEGVLSLIELVEDELLLALPMFPAHGEGECTAPGDLTPSRRGGGERSNPFVALQELKKARGKR
jgi:uncharacterized protein